MPPLIVSAAIGGTIACSLARHVGGAVLPTREMMRAGTAEEFLAAEKMSRRRRRHLLATAGGDDDSQFTSGPLLADHFHLGLPGFYHGVASGDPLPDAVVLWTRYTPTSVDEKVRLELRIARRNDRIPLEAHLDPTLNDGDDGLRIEIVVVDSSTDFCAKVDVRGLEPGTEYVYAFVAPAGSSSSSSSPVGQTRTAPAPDANMTEFTYALFSCAAYTNGYFHAYDVASTMSDLDLWVHIGDYIYEHGNDSPYADDSDARGEELMPRWEAVSLQDYRLRYAVYHHNDEGLRNLRRRAPLVAVWDDHEVTDNDYGDGPDEANAGAEGHQETCPVHDNEDGHWSSRPHDKIASIVALCQFDEGSIAERMNNAARAYMEWMPIRHTPGPMGVLTEDLGSLTQVIEWGNLATFVTFDSRISGRSGEPTLSSVFADFATVANSTLNVTEFTDPDSPVKAQLDEVAASVRDKMYDPRFTMIGEAGTSLLRSVFNASKDAGKPWQLWGSSTLLGPNVLFNPNTLWELAHPSIQDSVKQLVDGVLSSPVIGLFPRIMTAMAVTKTPWNRDDFNGFAHERTEILDICEEYGNNVVILGGDLHDSWAWTLHGDGGVQGGEGAGAEVAPPVAVNIGAPGVTAPGVGMDLLAAFEPIDNALDIDAAYTLFQRGFEEINDPGTLVHAEVRHKGFVAVKVTREMHVAEYYHVSPDDVLRDYPTARAANRGEIGGDVGGAGLTASYFCSGAFVTYADRPGSLVKSEGPCGTVTFETLERPEEWGIPVPLGEGSDEATTVRSDGAGASSGSTSLFHPFVLHWFGALAVGFMASVWV